MGRRLRMTAELGGWLAELSESEPPAAAEVGASLVAVLDSADPSGLAVVAEPSTPDPRETADRMYQQLREHLQIFRRRVAGAATARRAAELRLAERRGTGADAAEVAELEHDLADAERHEASLTELAERLQRDVDSFRSGRESGKAMHTAAEAQLRIADLIAASEGRSPEADVAELTAALRAAEERIEHLIAQARETLIALGNETLQQAGEQPGQGHPGRPAPPPAPPADPAPGLLELRADQLGSDILILFALEPTDTVTLLAVLEGPEAISEHGSAALQLASDLLTEIRDHGWPADVDEVDLADADTFVARFFPAHEDEIRRRAEAVAATVALRQLRENLDLSVTQVAARSGLPADRVAEIETDGLRTAQVHEAVALARVLGARLELPGGSGPVAG